MNKSGESSKMGYAKSAKDVSALRNEPAIAEVDERDGIDLWISLSIEGKRREILKQQMTSQINQMKTLRFDYHG
jgi:hypothetical protein